jgi:TrmH family RNA methyltransferase
MANMDLESLVLVEPAVPLGRVARAFAVGASKLLDGAQRAPSLEAALAEYQRVVGTTSARQRRPRVPLLHPRELPDFLAQDPPATRSALVFGPEPTGLTRDELALCCPVVSIPTAEGRSTLNLAQAVLIVAYEWFTARVSGEADEPPRLEPLATSDEIEGLLRQAEMTLQRVGFARDDSFGAVRRDLRRWAARGMTARQVRVLRGLCRRLDGRIASLESRHSKEPPTSLEE